MRDQEIYREIALVLARETPDSVSEAHILARVLPMDVTSVLWHGKKLSRESNFVLSTEGNDNIVDLSLELQSFYRENNMGDWNVYHYTLGIHSNKFNIDFENSREIEEGLPFWKYRQRYQ